MQTLLLRRSKAKQELENHFWSSGIRWRDSFATYVEEEICKNKQFSPQDQDLKLQIHTVLVPTAAAMEGKKVGTSRTGSRWSG